MGGRWKREDKLKLGRSTFSGYSRAYWHLSAPSKILLHDSRWSALTNSQSHGIDKKIRVFLYVTSQWNDVGCWINLLLDWTTYLKGILTFHASWWYDDAGQHRLGCAYLRLHTKKKYVRGNHSAASPATYTRCLFVGRGEKKTSAGNLHVDKTDRIFFFFLFFFFSRRRPLPLPFSISRAVNYYCTKYYTVTLWKTSIPS